jgi:hypothetical protein
MRRSCLVSCCLGAALCAGIGCGAHAQEPARIGGSGSLVGPPAERTEERAELIGPGDGLFQNSPGGVGVTRRTLTQQDGSLANRSGVVGSWSLAPRVDAGVGLFSVTADARKQADTTRMPSTDSVAPKRRRIAAVGLKVSF